MMVDSPGRDEIYVLHVFGLILLYKTGTSTITQEAFPIFEAL